MTEEDKQQLNDANDAFTDAIIDLNYQLVQLLNKEEYELAILKRNEILKVIVQTATIFEIIGGMDYATVENKLMENNEDTYNKICKKYLK